MVYLFLFILSRLSSHISRKSYEKSISPLLTKETGYKKASGSQMMNKLMLAKQIELYNKADKYYDDLDLKSDPVNKSKIYEA